MKNRAVLKQLWSQMGFTFQPVLSEVEGASIFPLYASTHGHFQVDATSEGEAHLFYVDFNSTT